MGYTKKLRWESIEDILDAVKQLVDTERSPEQEEIECVYYHLCQASDSAYRALKKLRNGE